MGGDTAVVICGDVRRLFVQQTEPTSCLFTAYANGCVRLMGVVPDSTPKRMLSSTLAAMDVWIREDRVIRIGIKVKDALISPGIYLAIVFTVYKTRHAVIIDNSKTQSPMLIDGTCKAPLPFVARNLKWVKTWSKIFRLEPCNNKKQNKKFKGSWMASH